MRVPFDQLKAAFERVLTQLSFPPNKAEVCAHIFASNSRDGVYSHGLNRFPTFVGVVKQGFVDPITEAECTSASGSFEIWNGHYGPGIYNSMRCMNRAVELAKETGMGCVAIHHNNHWMRGGTYGWQAAEAGCIGICFTNASSGLPPWGGTIATLGNNPLVIAVPRKEGHIVLDMAMTQYSYGKLQQYQLNNESLPYPGGYDEKGILTTDPAAIIKSRRALPIGLWKGSGLALMLDLVLTALTGGRSTADMETDDKEVGLSQCFIAFHQNNFHPQLVQEILDFTMKGNEGSTYPGENTLKRRAENDRNGIPVNEKIWNSVLAM